MKLKTIFGLVAIFSIAFLACKPKSKVAHSFPDASPTAKTAFERNDSTLQFFDWNTGYTLAKKWNKILLVDVYTEWCGWCKVMDRETYADKSVIALLNKDFICVKFNPEIANDSLVFETAVVDNRALHSFLFDRRSSGYPTTTFWLNPNKQEKLEVVAGYLDVDRFTALLNQVKEAKANSTP